MKQTFRDAKVLFNGVEIAEIEHGSYEFESDGGDIALVPGVQISEFIGPSLEMDQHVARLLQFAWFEMLPSITPDGATRGACLGVFAWRMLAELQAPLHRRAAMAHYWIRAMQARYVVCADTLPGCCVPGNQREVLSAYDRIRKE